MSTVLDKLLSSRETNLITRMIPASSVRNPIKRCELKRTGRNKSNIKIKHAALKTDRKRVFRSKSKILPFEKKLTFKKGECHTKNALPSLNSFESYLDLVKKWINPSVSNDSLEDKAGIWKDMKKSDETDSKENIKRTFDAELFRYAKKLKNVPKDIERKPYASEEQLEIQTKTDSKNLKFTGKVVQSVADEENYEYIESDSSCDKFCNPLENMNEVSQHAEQFEIKETMPALIKEDSKTLITAKKDSTKDFQLQSIGSRNNSAENFFELNKCISIEHIDLNAKLKKNFSSEQSKQGDLRRISQNDKTESITGNSLKDFNVNDECSKDSCNREKNGSSDDFKNFLDDLSKRIVDSLESNNQTMTSGCIEKINFDQTNEIEHSKDFEKSISSRNGRNAALTKDNNCSSEVKISLTKNNLSKNCKKKTPQVKMLKNEFPLKSNLIQNEQTTLTLHKSNSLYPEKCKKKLPQPKMSQNAHFLESKQSHKECKTLSISRDSSLNNKTLKNIQEVKLDPSSNKNSISATRKKLTINKNVNNSKEMDIQDSRKRNKYQYKENEKKIPNSKSSNDTEEVKINSAQCKKNAPSIKIPKKVKVCSQNDQKTNDQRLNKQSSSSKKLCDSQGAKFSSSQRKSNKYLDQETKSENNSNKICKNKCAVRNEENITRSATQKRATFGNELSENREGIDIPKNIRKKGIVSKKLLLQATNVLIDAHETKHISSKNVANVNTTERDKFSIVLSKSIDNIKTLVQGISPTISPKLTKEKMTQKECSSDISSENARNAKYLKEEYSTIPSFKDAEIMQLTGEFPPETVENSKTLKHENSGYISSIPPKDIEEVYMTKDELSAVTLPENIKKSKLLERNSTNIAARDAENAKMSKGIFSVIPKENIGCDKRLEEENSPVISSENIIGRLQVLEEGFFTIPSKISENEKVLEKANPKSLQILDEEDFFIIPPQSTRNEKTFEEENPSIIPSDAIKNLQILRDKSFSAIPSENTVNEDVLKSSSDIQSKNTVNSKELNEESSSLREDSIEYLSEKRRKEKKAEVRTFTNLPVRRVQKDLRRLKEMKAKVPKTKDSKPDENYKRREIIHKTQPFSDKINTKFNSGFGTSETTYIACTSRDHNHARDTTNSTKGYQSKASEKSVKTKKILKNRKKDTEK